MISHIHKKRKQGRQPLLPVLRIDRGEMVAQTSDQMTDRKIARVTWLRKSMGVRGRWKRDSVPMKQEGRALEMHDDRTDLKRPAKDERHNEEKEAKPQGHSSSQTAAPRGRMLEPHPKAEPRGPGETAVAPTASKSMASLIPEATERKPGLSLSP